MSNGCYSVDLWRLSFKLYEIRDTKSSIMFVATKHDEQKLQLLLPMTMKLHKILHTLRPSIIMLILHIDFLHQAQNVVETKNIV